MRLRIFLVLIASVMFITACASTETSETDENQDESEKEVENEGGVEVDKGLLNVEVTLPELFLEEEEMEEIIEEAKEDGISEVKQNEDGSLTLKMSKKEHKKMMKEMNDDIVESVDEMINDDDYDSIKDITYNKSFSEFTMVVNKEGFEDGLDGFAALGLGILGMYFQVFNGDDLEKNKVKILVQDESTGDVFNEITYPDALEEMEE